MQLPSYVGHSSLISPWPHYQDALWLLLTLNSIQDSKQMFQNANLTKSPKGVKDDTQLERWSHHKLNVGKPWEERLGGEH